MVPSSPLDSMPAKYKIPQTPEGGIRTAVVGKIEAAGILTDVRRRPGSLPPVETCYSFLP